MIPLSDERATRVVNQMYDKDAFSQWLGIERVCDGMGTSVLRMEVRPEMLNGFGIAHGAITYALADSALAFAANSHGRMSVSVETSISHLVAVRAGDVITATAVEESCTNKVGLYVITVVNQRGEKVALFKGTVYRTSKLWE
jgi:acyl-CoA thioesterase